MREISGVWDQLTDISQANILEMLGGKRNANVVAALLTNFKTAESVMKYTANAEGSALAENAKYLDSIEGSIQKFDVALEEFSMNFIGTDMVKDVVDLGTSLMKVLNIAVEISNVFGGLKGTIGAVATVASSMLAGKAIAAIQKSEKKEGGLFSFAPWVAYKDFRESYKEQKDKNGSGAKSFIKNTKGATKATFAAMDAAHRAASAFGVVGIAIGAVSGVISYFQKRSEDARNATLDGLAAYEESSKGIEEYKSRIIELRQALDYGNLSSSEAYDVRSELLSIEQEIIDKYGEQDAALQLVNGDLERQLELVNQINDAELDSWYETNKGDIDKATKKVTTADTEISAQVSLRSKDGGTPQDLFEDAFGDSVVTTKTGNGLSYKFTLDADVDDKTAVAGLRDVFSEAEKIRDSFKKGTTEYEQWDNFLTNISGEINTLEEDLTETWDIYERAMTREVAKDSNYSKTWSDFIAQEGNLENLVLDGASIEEQSAVFQIAKEHITELIAEAERLGDTDALALFKNELRDLESTYGELEPPINLNDLNDRTIQGLRKGVEAFRNETDKIDVEKLSDIALQIQEWGTTEGLEASDITAYNQIAAAAEKAGYYLASGEADVKGFAEWLNSLGTIDEIFETADSKAGRLDELIGGNVSTDKAKQEINSLVSEIIALNSLDLPGFNINEILGLDDLGITFDQLKGTEKDVFDLILGLGLSAEESAGQIELLSSILKTLGFSDEAIEFLWSANEQKAKEEAEKGTAAAQETADNNPVKQKTDPPDPNPEPAKEAGEMDGEAYADGFNAGASKDGVIDPDREINNHKIYYEGGQKDAESYRDGYTARQQTTMEEIRHKNSSADFSNEKEAYKGGQKDRQAYIDGYKSRTEKTPGQEGGITSIADSPTITPQSDMTEFEAGVRKSREEIENDPAIIEVKARVNEASKMTTMEEIRHKNAGSVTVNTGNESTNKIVNVTINPADAAAKLKNIADSMSEIPKSKKSSLKISCPGKTTLDDAFTKWNSIKTKKVTLTFNVDQNALGTYHNYYNKMVQSGYSNKYSNKIYKSGNLRRQSNKSSSGTGTALGTYHGTANALGDNQVQKSTISLVGELGQEMLVRPSTGEWRTIGNNGPEFIPIRKGDIIFNARQTRELLTSGRILSHADSYGTAFANGTATTLSPSSGSKVHGSINVNITASADGEISDSLKEELDKIQKNIDEIIGNFEHEISIGEFKNASADQMIAIYKKMQDAVHQKANEYRAKGLSENSDYIQDLTKQWWEYNQAIQDLTIEQFEDTQKNYENAIELTKNWMNVALEESDYSGIVKYSNDIISYYKSMQDEAHKQAEYYRSLGYSETSDEVSELSSLWYEYGEKMNEAIQDAYDNMIENTSKAVDEITGFYESLQEAASQFDEYKHIDIDTFQEITELGVEYLSLLEDENGQLVINKDNINKIIAAKTEQLGIETALNYISQLRIALTERDADEIGRLLDVTKDASKSTWDLVYSQLALLGLSDEQYAAAKNNIDNIYSLTTATIGSIGSIGESTEEALDTILDYVMELVQHEVEDKIEGLEEQIDKYNEIIDKQKESLRLTKEQQEYEDEVSDKLEEINKIQNEIDLLSLDDSLEGKARRQELEEELAELQKDLAEKQDDHAYDTINESLDKMAEDNEERISEEIEKLNESISSTQKIYDLAVEKIKNTTWDTLYDELINWNYEYGSSLTQELVNAWNQATEAAKEYGGYLEYLEATGKLSTSESVDKDSGKNSNIVADKKVFDDSKTKNQTVNKEQEAKDWLERMKANSKAWIVADDAGNEAETKRLDAENLDLGKKLGDYLGADLQRGTSEDGEHANGVWYIGDPSEGKRLYDYEFDSKKRASNFNTANNLLDEMIANAKAWKSVDDPNSQRLAARNEEIAKQIISLTGYDITKHEGAWYVGSYKNGVRLFDTKTGYKLDLLKLNNANYVYHTGGVAGDKSTVKQNEVMALLEKGELIIDKKREEGLYKAVDFIEVLSNKLGKSIEISKLGSLIQGSSISASLTSVPDVGNIVNNNMNFNPHVEVNISHSGPLSDKDANKFGKITANSVIGELNEAFQRRGINNIGNAILR